MTVPAPDLYKLIPLNILAFQWDGKTSLDADSELPKWLRNLVLTQKASSVLKEGSEMSYLHNKRGDYKVFPGDWICMDEFSHIFVVSQKTFALRCNKTNEELTKEI